MKQFLKIYLISLLIFLFAPQIVFAARNLSITSSSKNALFGDEEVFITASQSGFTNGETIYIKGALYQEGSTNYFGYTKNGDNWTKNSAATANQRQIKIGDWDGNLIFKSDFTDSGYKGEGSYKLKLGYYYLTSTGTISSPISWSSNILDVDISEPDPTPTPTSLPTPTSVPIKVPTPAPTKITTSTSTPGNSKYSTKLATQSASMSSKSAILGTNSADKKQAPTPTKSKRVLVKSAAESNFVPTAIIIAAILFICCGILVYWKKRRKDKL